MCSRPSHRPTPSLPVGYWISSGHYPGRLTFLSPYSHSVLVVGVPSRGIRSRAGVGGCRYSTIVPVEFFDVGSKEAALRLKWVGRVSCRLAPGQPVPSRFRGNLSNLAVPFFLPLYVMPLQPKHLAPAVTLPCQRAPVRHPPSLPRGWHIFHALLERHLRVFFGEVQSA